MAKKIIKPINSAPSVFQPVFNFPFRSKCIFLALIGFIFYANTILNKYAFDDGMAIEYNSYVKMGFRGIPKILTKDSFVSFYDNMGYKLNKSSGDKRYRPIAEIIFAIEQQVFDDSALLPFFRHFINVVAYMTCIIAIFYFLENFLLKKPALGGDIAFLSTFLFAIHPLHTEVVANIKSLDEILSLLFIVCTFIYGLKYLENKQIKHLALGVVSFLLALLSEEFAVTLIFFIPFLFYILNAKNPVSAIISSIPYYAVFVIYLILRYNAVGLYSSHIIQDNDIMRNPYFYATHAQKVATEWFVLGKYLGLLFFPYPLACDYSYYQIKYHNFSDISVLMSIIIYLSFFVWGVMLTRKKIVLSFAVFFLFFNIFMVSNLVIDIGPAMGERLAFHSSLGFVIILSFYLIKAISNFSIHSQKRVAAATILVIGLVCFGETVIRNSQWKNNNSLFIHDVNVVPDSFLENNNAGAEYLTLSERKENTPEQAKSYIDSARKYLFRVLHFNKSFDVTYRNLGVMYVHLGLFDSAKYCYDIIKKLRPDYPGLQSGYALLSKLYFARGLHLSMNNNPRYGVINMRKALLIDSTNSSIWYNTAIAYYQLKLYDSARYAFIKTLQYNPDTMDAINSRKNLKALLQTKN